MDKQLNFVEHFCIYYVWRCSAEQILHHPANLKQLFWHQRCAKVPAASFVGPRAFVYARPAGPACRGRRGFAQREVTQSGDAPQNSARNFGAHHMKPTFALCSPASLLVDSLSQMTSFRGAEIKEMSLSKTMTGLFLRCKIFWQCI